jgi:hypothetical protein
MIVLLALIIKKAFDTVNNQILLRKLYNYRVSCVLTPAWFQIYLKISGKAFQLYITWQGLFDRSYKTAKIISKGFHKFRFHVFTLRTPTPHRKAYQRIIEETLRRVLH